MTLFVDGAVVDPSMESASADPRLADLADLLSSLSSPTPSGVGALLDGLGWAVQRQPLSAGPGPDLVVEEQYAIVFGDRRVRAGLRRQFKAVIVIDGPDLAVFERPLG